MSNHKEEKNKHILDRMSYLIGHLQANRKMIEDGRYCINIIRQNNAVISAIKKVNEIILSSHLDSCATTAIRDGDLKKRQKVLTELLEIYESK